MTSGFNLAQISPNQINLDDLSDALAELEEKGKHSMVMAGVNSVVAHKHSIAIGYGAQTEEDGEIVIRPKDGKTIRFKSNGDIVIGGEKVGSDMDVVNAFREVLLDSSGMMSDEQKKYLDKQKIKSFTDKL